MYVCYFSIDIKKEAPITLIWDVSHNLHLQIFFLGVGDITGIWWIAFYTRHDGGSSGHLEYSHNTFQILCYFQVTRWMVWLHQSFHNNEVPHDRTPNHTVQWHRPKLLKCEPNEFFPLHKPFAGRVGGESLVCGGEHPHRCKREGGKGGCGMGRIIMKWDIFWDVN